jgi:hypothetical protein
MLTKFILLLTLTHTYINNTNLTVQGAAPPPAHFDAAGYNDSFYAWKSGNYDASYWNGSRNNAFCNSYLKRGGNSETGDSSCRAHDPTYNEWFDLDVSASPFKSISEPVDPGGVDDWLNDVGGGIYKARPTQLLRFFAR